MLFALVTLGCRGGGEAGERGAPEGEPAYGDMAVIGLISDADNMFPPLSTTRTASDVHGNIFWPLMRSNPDFITYRPGLADSFRFGEDSLFIDFFIHPGVTWHDGHPFTAEDVVFAQEVCKAPEINWSEVSSLDHLTDVRAIDSLTVRFTFDEKYMYQVFDANICLPLPGHILEGVPYGEMQRHWMTERPIGNGPYALVSWKREQEIILVANTDFVRGRPYLNRLTYRIIPERTTMATQVQNGTIDVWEFGPQFYPQLKADPDLIVHSYPGRHYTYLAYNTKDPLFEDKRVRQALTLAIDRQQIVDALLHGQGTVGTQPLISTIWAHDETIEPWPYDPERAKRLLEEAGWSDRDGDRIREKDGQNFSFEINTSSGGLADILTIVQSQLRRVGIDAKPMPLEFNTLVGRLHDRRFRAVVLGWSVSIKAELTTFHSGERFNYPQAENATLDSLIEAAEVERDRAKAKALWSQAQRIIIDEAYYTFLFQINDLMAIDRRFQNVKPNAYSWSDNIEEWYVPEGRQRYKVPLGAAPTARAGVDTAGGARAR